MSGDQTVEVPVGGLASSDVIARRERDGTNVLPARPPIPIRRRIARQLRDPLIMVLLIAAALTVVTGDWTDMGVILLVITVNTVVGVSQEVRADQAITALSQLTAPSVRVMRDGKQQEIPAAEVVVGDLLVLGEGDIVPADARVVQAAAVLVDESSLTGESVPVGKTLSGDRRLASGTVVVKGRARAVVTAVGAASATGRIASMLNQSAGLTPLQRRLADVGRLLAAVTVVLGAVVLALGLLRGQPVELMVVTAISLVVAAVPESLPAVVTLALALGARRMAARNALIRKLPAVETLGSVTILATDKTGTLTEGSMVVRRVWTPTGETTVTGSGYAPDGQFLRDGRPVDVETVPEVEAVLSAAVLCSDARLVSPETGSSTWTALGDPTEAALLAAAAKAGLDQGVLARALPRVDERPFDSDRKRMSTLHALPDGGYRVICKGAPEAMLQQPVLVDPPELLGRAAERAGRLAQSGFRVLAVAVADQMARPGSGADLERGLRLVGLVAIHDPPRSAAAGTITACRTAGVAPILITGDHPGTAEAIAQQVGIIGATGSATDCAGLNDDDVGEAAAGGVRVFARAAPRHKLAIIQALRGQGHIVAMTGDGVNDGPALHRSDIGVAMGERGTEVARQAADLVLADDNLDTLIAAVEEGRRVYSNIRRFLVYGLSGGAAEIAVMLLGPFLGLALPLLPAQILWINLITHGLPGVALGGEPAEHGAMNRPPRPPAQSILGGGLWQRVPRIALVLTAVTLGVAVWAHHTGRPWQSMAFFALGTTQLGVALGSRSRPHTWANPMLLVSVAGALILQLAGLYFPPLRDLLGTRPLTPADLLIVAALSVLGYVAVRLDRLLHPSSAASRAG